MGEGEDREYILGIPFWTGSCEEAVQRALAGGLVVAPSGPGLASDLRLHPEYAAAVKGADLVLTDSGYMVLCHALLTGCWIPRHSGLKFLKMFLESQRPDLIRSGQTYWVMPSAENARRNRAWLNEQGYEVEPQDCYLAPHFEPGKIFDNTLLNLIQQRRPKVVVICIGGGRQEPLGAWLRANLSYRPTILCTGAAIAFLSSVQTNIPPWAVRLFLGWFLRFLSDPANYCRRYCFAAPLLFDLARERASK